MSELDDFRPRIRNWGRVYRNRFHRSQSPLAVVLHDLQMQAGRGSAPVSEGLPSLDYQDAALLDSCALKLDRNRLEVLRIEYLDGHTSMTYDTAADARRAEHLKARKAGVQSRRYWMAFVVDAEAALMRLVQSREAALDKSSQFAENSDSEEGSSL